VNITRSPAWLHHHVIADEVNHRLLPWLEQHADEPFFVFVHYWDPHIPYNMPAKFRGKFDRRHGDLVTERAPDGYEFVPGWGPIECLPTGDSQLSVDLYDDEIFYVDHSVGRVREKLEQLDLLDETVIIVTSDHGEDLDLHGLWGHATVHNTTIFVPLIIRDPRYLPTGERIKGFVQHVDNLPSILEYFPQQQRASFERVTISDHMPHMPSYFDGNSLLELAHGERTAPEEIVVESGAHRAILAPPWKLIWHRNGERELFNLHQDPLELHNRIADEGTVVDELTEVLRQWVARNLGEERTDPLFASEGAWTCYIGEKETRYDSGEFQREEM
jgi:arylsulfatase A-like enzyme